MSDDLVKRLREYRIGCGIHCSAYDAREPLDECIEAADRIEQDAQHIDEMYELVAAMNADHTASKTRIEKLEAALAKIAQHDMQAIAMDALRPGERIRKALDAE